MDKRVVITGMGVVTPIGNNITEFWQHLKEGVCGIRPIEGIEEDIPIHVAGQVRDFDPIAQGLTSADVRRSDRYSQFAVAASIQAMAQSGLVAGENIAPERLGVYIGSGIGGMQTFVDQTKVLVNEGARRISPLFIPMMISNIAAGNVAIRFHAQGVCLPVVSACATSTHAAGEAFRAIKHGYADAILTGGSEAAVHALAIGGFANSKALSTTTNPAEASIPFDRRRNGFVMAEGAGVLLFEELEHARKRGATILAEVVGYGNSCDAYHYTAPRPDGAAASNAMRQALEEASFTAGEALYINAHGTSTPLNDKTETQVIKLALGEEEARKASISSTKSMTGHMLGATGAVELIASALALRDGVVPPTIGLQEADPECDLDYTPAKAKHRALDVAISNSLGFGGHNACVALRKFNL
ncbi:MAG: beta-ketoacyl-ACP synthase II [Alistipes sp.]|nr:beta-ketoacyl-ACP synthase II [Alistipes sp.]